MAKKKGTEGIPPAPAALSSLADLMRERGLRVAPDAPTTSAPQAPAPAEPGEPALPRTGKIVLRRERRGHGGKTVTVVEGLRLSPAQLETVARRMRKALGCGARVDGDRLVLQGDLAPAAEAWLRGQGATRVVQGN
jgi:translation initiation factor 1